MAASLNVYYGKSAALALILSQEAPKQLHRGNGGRLRVSSRSQCEQQKPHRWPGNEATVNFVCTCLRTQLTTELNRKLTKHSQKTLDTGHLHGGKNAGVRTWLSQTGYKAYSYSPWALITLSHIHDANWCLLRFVTYECMTPISVYCI